MQSTFLIPTQDKDTDSNSSHNSNRSQHHNSQFRSNAAGSQLCQICPARIQRQADHREFSGSLLLLARVAANLAAAFVEQVIKIGTSSLINEKYGTLNLSSLSRICEVVRELHAKGKGWVCASAAVAAATAEPALVEQPDCPSHQSSIHLFNPICRPLRHHRQQRRDRRRLPAAGAVDPPQQDCAEAGAGCHRAGPPDALL